MKDSKSRRWQKVIILISIAAGVLFILEGYFHFFRTRSISLEPDYICIEEVFWENMVPNDLRYWPLFYLNRKILVQKLEKRLPVQVDSSLSGFGQFRFTFCPIHPLVAINWKDILWYVGRNGKIWEKSRSMGLLRDDISVVVFEVGNDFPSPVPEGVMGSEKEIVHQSLLPMELILKWKESVESLPWFGHVNKIIMDRRAGEHYLIFSLNSEKGRIELLMRSDPAKWLEVVEALDKIMPEFPVGCGNVFIDAAYKDKIVVKEMHSWAD